MTKCKIKKTGKSYRTSQLRFPRAKASQTAASRRTELQRVDSRGRVWRIQTRIIRRGIPRTTSCTHKLTIWVQTITFPSTLKSKKPQWATERAHRSTIRQGAVRQMEAMAANLKADRVSIWTAHPKTTRSPRIHNTQKWELQIEATK